MYMYKYEAILFCLSIKYIFISSSNFINSKLLDNNIILFVYISTNIKMHLQIFGLYET
jgi:hypothetical protein